MNRSKQGRMGKKTIARFTGGLALASVRFAEAQQPKRSDRLPSSCVSPALVNGPRSNAFRQGSAGAWLYRRARTSSLNIDYAAGNG